MIMLTIVAYFHWYNRLHNLIEHSTTAGTWRIKCPFRFSFFWLIDTFTDSIIIVQLMFVSIECIFRNNICPHFNIIIESESKIYNWQKQLRHHRIDDSHVKLQLTQTTIINKNDYNRRNNDAGRRWGQLGVQSALMPSVTIITHIYQPITYSRTSKNPWQQTFAYIFQIKILARHWGYIPCVSPYPIVTHCWSFATTSFNSGKHTVLIQSLNGYGTGVDSRISAIS